MWVVKPESRVFCTSEVGLLASAADWVIAFAWAAHVCAVYVYNKLHLYTVYMYMHMSLYITHQ